VEQFSPYQEYRSNLHIWNYTYNTWNLAMKSGLTACCHCGWRTKFST